MNLSNVLISEKDINIKVKEIAKKISDDYKNQEVILVGILKGASIFLSDLVRNLDLENVKIDFMSVSSYGMGSVSSGIVKILKDLDNDINGKNVIIVEDIVDTGLTLEYLKKYLLQKNANSIKICTLLDKPIRRKCDINIDYKGFEIEDKFIVGYGIDFQEKFRNLPYIAYIEE